jgi:tRNA (cytidine/uridine-2'-O-)-methyltransferase
MRIDHLPQIWVIISCSSPIEISKIAGGGGESPRIARIIGTIGNNGADMLHVALWEPEIPPNTGNIARLCAATGAKLHLIGRLGFRLDDRRLKRAGLDYWESIAPCRHRDLAEFEAAFHDSRIFCFSARAEQAYTKVAYQQGDVLLFGGETFGLPQEVHERYRQRSLVIPMPAGKVRSLNLATAVGIVVYEALRQLQSW